MGIMDIMGIAALVSCNFLLISLFGIDNICAFHGLQSRLVVYYRPLFMVEGVGVVSSSLHRYLHT